MTLACRTCAGYIDCGDGAQPVHNTGQALRKVSEEAVRLDVRENNAVGIDVAGREGAVPLDASCRNIWILADEVKRGAAQTRDNP